MKKFIFCILIIILILQFKYTYAATYYVSNNNCSDSNTGYENSPWCHCPGMNGWTGNTTLNPGDIVFFDSGDTWSASSGGYILNLTGGVSYVGDSWGSGTKAKFIAYNNLGAAPGSMVNFHQDHPTYPTVFQGFELDGNGQFVNGIGFNRSISYGLMTGATKRVQNCSVHDQNSTGGYTYGIIVSHFLVPNPENYITENVEILDNIVYNQGRTGITIYTSNTNDNCRIGNMLIRGNETYNTALAPDYDAGVGIVVKNHVHDVVIEYNYIHGYNGNTGTAAYIDADVQNCSGPRNITFRYNILNCTSNANLQIRNYGNKSFDIYGNIFYGSVGSQGILIASNRDSINAKIYNNILFNDSIILQNHSATGEIELKNNIIYSASNTPLIDPGGNITSHNNNIFYRSGFGNILVSSGGTSFTESNLSTYEITALSSDPLLINTSNLPTGFVGTNEYDIKPNTDGLSLQENSPAIDAGEALGSNYTISINSIVRPQGSNWDIGAYEYSDGSEPADNTPPIRDLGLPTGTLPASTTEITLSLSTDENATCRYETTGDVEYSLMTNTFSNTGSVSHSTTINNLNNGDSYNYYVKCIDISMNANPDDYLINFSVASFQASSLDAPSNLHIEQIIP